MLKRFNPRAFGESKADFLENQRVYLLAQIADFKQVLFTYANSKKPMDGQDAREALQRYGLIPLEIE